MKTLFTNCKFFTFKTLAIGSIAFFSFFISKAQNPLITENHFNIITEGNLTITQGDIEGAIAVGGNLVVLGNSQRTSANATGGQAFMTFNNVKYALVVNGGLTGTNGGNVFKIDGKGAATDDHFIRFGTIGTSTTAASSGGIDIGNPVTDNTKRYVRVNSTNQAANTVVNTTDLFNFSDAFTTFRASATSISTCTGNVSPTVSGGQATLNLGTFANNVWNVTGATLNGYSQINLTGNLPTASRPLIINVNAAGTFNWSNVKFIMGSETDNSMEINRAPYILWNFYNATTLNIQNSNLVLGSILAPNADLRNNGTGNITGQIVAKTFTKPNAGELHIAKFNANVTCATTYDCGCVTSASNVLVNPSFEQNGAASTTGWAHAGQGSISAGNGFVACGSFNGFNNNPNGTGESLVYQDVTANITSGIDFTFSGFAATHEVSCNPRLYVEYYSTASGTTGRIGNRVEVAVTKDVDIDGKLALYTIDGVTPAGTVRIRVGTVINCDYVKMDAYCLTLNCTKPATPTKGTITGPTCSTSTGSVIISGLPASGTWTLERTGTSAATITGTGTSTTISGLAPGTYVFKVTSNLGCVSDDLTNVVIPGVPSAPTLTAVPTNITCNGSNDGSINLTVSGGLSPYTFNWGAGQPTTEDLTGLAAGTYNVTVTDANSCTRTASATITEPTALAVTQTFVNPLCFGGTNGSIDLTVTGGTTAYTYNWGAGQPTTQDRTGLSAGTYNVTVTDAKGCTKTASIVISSPTELNLSITQINPACNGGATGSIDLTVTGGTANYTYNWGAGQPTTQDRTGLIAGTYNVTVTDANSCTKTASIIITQPAVLDASTTSVNLLCNGVNTGSIDLTVNGGTTPYSYNWGAGQPTTQDRSNLGAGTYNVTVTDANGCTKTASATITQPEGMTLSTTQVNPSCNGASTGSIDLIVSGGTPNYTYNWGNGQPTTQDRTGLTAGTYTVTVTDANGCTKTASATITEPPVLALSTTQVNPACSGATTGSIDLTVSGGTPSYTYNWGTGQPTTQDRTGLSAGTYNVTVTDANGCTKSTSVTITEPAPSSLGNYTFIDNNANGIQDAGDTPLDGVLVKLYNANANGTPNGAAIATATTAGGGLYNFPNLCAGNYVIEFGTATGGYNRTTQANNASKDPTDSDANPTTGFTGLITIAAGDNDMTNDAGYFKPASLGNYVWEDNNVNGQQDSGEPAIANVTVSLQDASGNQALDVNGNPVPNTTTNGLGEYAFTNLKPGVGYVVVFSKPAGYVPTTQNSGNDNTDSDASPTTGKSQVVTLASGENNLTIDAGFFKPASLGNFVWEDKNLNGQQDSGEPGIPNVIVSLQDASGNPALDANGNVVPNTTTNGLGEYNFTNLKPGNGYVVVFSKPAGYSPTVANNGNDATDSDANISDGKSPVITLAAGENNLTIDAGFYKIASLGNFVWEDKNLNGQQDSGEPGIPNVTVSLKDALGNPALDINGTPVANTTTNGNGEYVFNNLKPGEPYVVVFTKPAGYYPTVGNSGNDASDSDANVTDGKAPIVVLTSGEYNQTIDAGFYRPASLGNFVWEDKNSNGQQDPGEPVIPNVSVSLQNASGNPAVDINGNPVPSTTTNGAGEYTFTNLMPGIPYIVVFSKPSSFTTTPVNTGDDNSDSDANTLTGKSQPVTLQSGEYNQTVDAGYYKLASLGNYAWYDANRNGVQDGGELPAGGVLVELFKSNGTLVGTKTTDMNGLYLFDNLTPGDYYIRGTHPDSFFKPTTANQGANDEIDSDISTDLKTSIVTSLESGENDLTWDMGYYRGAKFDITDPCKCRNDATNLVNGRYNEEVTVTGTPGELWTVKSQNGILLNTSAAPPAAGTPMPLGTQLIESPVGSGMFKLLFQHVDAIGYAISVTNENTPGIDPQAIFTGNQTNVCLYPEPNYNKVTTSACSNAQPIELTAQPNMPGVIKYTLSNVNTQQLIVIMPDGNGKFFINPANVPAAKYDLIIEFTPTDVAKCKQIDILTAEFEVKTCGPLPVNLVSFDAKAIEDKVVLNWKTSSEKNFSHFEVQHSENLSEFTSIGSVNTTLTGLYSLIDNNPNTGNNYYRLKMVDNNGSFEFSKTVAVQLNKNEGYVIAENPAVNGQFSINTNLKNPQFNLYNSLATNVGFNLKVEGENKYSIAVSNYTAGTYYLTINAAGKIITKKIIIP